MLGISIYPNKQKEEEIINYIKVAYELGFKRIFTTLLTIDENNKNELVQKYKNIIQFANKIGMETTLDVSPSIFKILNISYDDLSFFNEMGVKTIRLDEGFDGLKESELTYNKYNINIEINMSNATKYLDNIISFKPNKSKLLGCHNFYPQELTGLANEHFLKCSKNFKKHNIRTAAFVTSQFANIGPWPIMDGLCTLEMHRSLPITSQVKHLILTELIDDIIIGNAYASLQELQEISNIYFSNILTFKIKFSMLALEVEKNIVFNEFHFYRGDVSEFLIRSTQSRTKYKSVSIKENNSHHTLNRGDIIICNDNFGNYKGELQIVLINQSNIKHRKNFVGKICDQELFLLDWIRPWSKFNFSANN